MVPYAAKALTVAGTKAAGSGGLVAAVGLTGATAATVGVGATAVIGY